MLPFSAPRRPAVAASHLTFFLVLVPVFLPVLFVDFFVVAGPASALATADLGGVVRSVDGTPLAGAQVLGFERSLGRRVATRSDEAGRYRFLGLTVGQWTVEATLPGYTIAVVEDLRLDVGVTRRLDLVLEPSDFEEMVVKSHFSPLVPTGVDGAESIDRADFDGLPLLDRSLGRVEELLDGPPLVVDERLADGAWASAAARRTGGPSGPPASADQVSLRSIHVGAAYAGAAGVVSLLTRAGTNQTRGDVFVLHTDDDLQESAAPRLGRWTWLGGSVGGALVEDRVHAFAAVEDVDGASGAAADDIRRSALQLSASPSGRGGDRHAARLRAHESRGLIAGSSSVDALDLLFGFRSVVGSRFHHGVVASRREAASAEAASADAGEVRWDLGIWRTRGATEHDLRAGFRVFEASDPAELALAGSRAIWIEDEVRLASGVTVRAGLRWDESPSPDLGLRSADDELSPRFGFAWDVAGDGRHVVRAGAGRFLGGAVLGRGVADRGVAERGVAERGAMAVDRVAVGWSWRLSPFLGLAFDARRLDGADEASRRFDEESADWTVRGRFTDAIRFRIHWGLFERPRRAADGLLEDGLRHRVVGSLTVDTPWHMRFGAVYRYLTAAESGVEPASQLDVRVARSFDLGDGPELEASVEIFDVLDQANNFDLSPIATATDDGALPTALRPSARLGLRLRF